MRLAAVMADGHSNGQPLSNADFRRLFETPRRVSDEDRGQRRNKDGQRHQHKKKPPRPKPEEEVEKKDEVPGYRYARDLAAQLFQRHAYAV